MRTVTHFSVMYFLLHVLHFWTIMMARTTCQCPRNLRSVQTNITKFRKICVSRNFLPGRILGSHKPFSTNHNRSTDDDRGYNLSFAGTRKDEHMLRLGASVYIWTHGAFMESTINVLKAEKPPKHIVKKNDRQWTYNVLLSTLHWMICPQGDHFSSASRKGLASIYKSHYNWCVEES